jgi:hypothetical protein
MDFIDVDQPMEAIKEWQDWYRKNPIVLESQVKAMEQEMKEKAQEHFADTIAEFSCEVSGKEMYKAFYAAAFQNMEYHEKEYQRAKELVDMLRYGNSAPDK